MSHSPDLDQLLLKAIAGDRGALVSLLEACAPKIRGRIEGKITGALRAHLDVDDVMQVTYLEAVTRISKFSSGNASAFQAWLSTLAEHNLIDAIRSLEAAKRPDPHKKVSGASTNSRDSMVALIDILGVTTTTPSIHAARDEAFHHLDKALKQLPRDYELVVRLYDLDGTSMEDVARQLNRSVGAAFMLRARAHDRLRDGIGPSTNFFSHTT